MAQRHNHHGRFWHLVHRLYRYRTWWLDVPSLLLIVLLHWEFYSNGIHPALHEFSLFFRAELAAYWLMKEGVRWKMEAIQARRGVIFVMVWVAVFAEFAFMMQAYPSAYRHLPEDMFVNTLYVVLGYFGFRWLRGRVERHKLKFLRFLL